MYHRRAKDRPSRRVVRAMQRIVPDFHDLDLGLTADDLVADLRPGLPMAAHGAESR